MCVISAGAISSNLSMGVNDSHPSQDFYQKPEEYIFDPDPGTKKNGFKFQGNLPSVLYHLVDPSFFLSCW